MEPFGQRLLRLRRDRGWKTRRAADQATGISVSTWTNLEARGQKPSITTASRLMEALEVSFDELLKGTDALPPENENAPPSRS